MAGYDDDFQGYSIGDQPPFGSWILDPSAFTKTITADAGGTGIPGTDRYLEIFLGTVAVNPAVTDYQTSFTQFSALKLVLSDPFGGANFQWSNGPNAGGFTFTILTVKVEIDGTVSVYDGVGTLLKNSNDDVFTFKQWNFLQQNITLSDDEILGVKYVRINYQLVLNGKSVLNFAITTTIAVAGLKNGTAQVNRFQLLGGHHGAYTLQGLTAANVYPHAGAPYASVYQAPIEVDVLPDGAEIEAFQAPIEVDVLPNDTLATVTQAPIEVDLKLANRWYISES